MALTLLEISLCLLLFVTILLAVLVFIKQQITIKSLRRKVAGNHSKELTEFLQDVSRHGYSFTRVDPVSVFMRSPRE